MSRWHSDLLGIDCGVGGVDWVSTDLGREPFQPVRLVGRETSTFWCLAPSVLPSVFELFYVVLSGTTFDLSRVKTGRGTSFPLYPVRVTEFGY